MGWLISWWEGDFATSGRLPPAVRTQISGLATNHSECAKFITNWKVLHERARPRFGPYSYVMAIPEKQYPVDVQGRCQQAWTLLYERTEIPSAQDPTRTVSVVLETPIYQRYKELKAAYDEAVRDMEKHRLASQQNPLIWPLRPHVARTVDEARVELEAAGAREVEAALEILAACAGQFADQPSEGDS